MRNSVIAMFLFLFLLAAPAAAQNPCTVAQPALSLVTATSDVVAIFSDYAAVLGAAPAWSDVDVSIFAKAANPATAIPVSSVTVAKAAWTLVPTTTDCYRHKPVILFGVQANTEYDLRIRTRRAADATFSAWTGALPFGRMGPPAVPTGVRTTP